jgi:hypothetical protein
MKGHVRNNRSLGLILEDDYDEGQSGMHKCHIMISL